MTCKDCLHYGACKGTYFTFIIDISIHAPCEGSDIKHVKQTAISILTRGELNEM